MFSQHWINEERFFCGLEVLPFYFSHLYLYYFEFYFRERNNFIIIIITHYYFVFLGPHPQHMEFPRLGVNQSCSHQPMPQPQQCRIWDTSGTYTTAHNNVGSLTHWVRPGIKPTSSWMLVGLVNCWAMTGTPYCYFCKYKYPIDYGQFI